MTETHFDLLTSSSFQLAFPVLPSETSLSSTEGLCLNTYGMVIPGLNIDQSEQRWMGAKSPVPEGTISFEPLSINFIVDSNLNNWKVLFNWLMYINNNFDTFVGRYDTYVVDTVLKMFDNFGEITVSLAFKNMWIQSLGEVTLSQREGEATMECNAILSYDRFTVT